MVNVVGVQQVPNLDVMATVVVLTPNANPSIVLIQNAAAMMILRLRVLSKHVQLMLNASVNARVANANFYALATVSVRLKNVLLLVFVVIEHQLLLLINVKEHLVNPALNVLQSNAQMESVALRYHQLYLNVSVIHAHKMQIVYLTIVYYQNVFL
jgi:hypothetical protein